MNTFDGVVAELHGRFLVNGNHSMSDYFGLIKELVARRNAEAHGSQAALAWQAEIDRVYGLVEDELISNPGPPVTPVQFGTSGWRGIIGKDLFVKSVGHVTLAIVEMYENLNISAELFEPLGILTFEDARKSGCVVGFDNRFGGPILAEMVARVLSSNGFTVHYAGESTTGVLSAAVLVTRAAFSINLTPSHNPLEYGGVKYNAADAGPAVPVLTNTITAKAEKYITADYPVPAQNVPERIRPLAALDCWLELVRGNQDRHGLDYDYIMDEFARRTDIVVAVDCVHGASRNHITKLFKGYDGDRLKQLRAENDPTFGGIAPEPSTANLKLVKENLASRPEPLKLGVIIDPDGDRIRFTDGETDIDMNKFGAMAYHFLHEIKGKEGMVAKTVATSNFANALADAFGEKTFEPRVGFKEFKPVIGQALVCFEESDGITVIGHTPEKDAYIGLLLALDMLLQNGKSLGQYLADIEKQYGVFYPGKDGVVVSKHGEALLATLDALEKYRPGVVITVGERKITIKKVIAIDGRKMILEDDSWLMIRPSGTEPKVRFYVEARSRESMSHLFEAARSMLAEIGLL